MSDGQWVELEGGGSVWVTQWDIVKRDILRGIADMGGKS